ncbi:hypothetical protein AX17_003123 [Amanita inopinata Kibby_2008]|nr:hypothetical protein AX17_003123 [Amanita inopinata Kibby_2008]
MDERRNEKKEEIKKPADDKIARFPEELAEDNGLDSKEMAKRVVKYADGKTRRFWKRLDGYDADYAVLKAKILGFYSKAELDGRSYTIKRLKAFISDSANDEMDDYEGFNAYYHRFRRMASFLVDCKKMDEDDRDEYFWEGLEAPSNRCFTNRAKSEGVDDEDTILPVPYYP